MVLWIMWPHEGVAIEVNQMVRRISNPDFGFPGNVGCEFSEGFTVQKGRDLEGVSFATGS